MAKPKFPKKSIDTADAVSNQNRAAAIATNAAAAAAAAPAPIPTASPAPMKEVIKTEAKAAETRKATRKPEIVRNESRANLVPISLDEEIRRLAYSLSERRGFEPGHETEDWLAAEYEVRQRYHQHSA